MINSPLFFKKTFHIFWYDGPILSLSFTEDNTPFFELYCDREINYNDYKKSIFTYSYMFTSLNDVIKLINNKISYYEVINRCDKFIIYQISEQKFYNFQSVPKEIFISKYGPKPEADLSDDLEPIKNEILQFIQSFST